MRQLWRISIFALLIMVMLPAVKAQDSSLMLAFVGKRGDNEDIFLTTQDNSITYNLTNARSRDWHPSWASDGRHIVFSTNRDGNNEVYVMDTNGDNPRNLTVNTASDTSPDWSPVSDEIAFVSDRDGGYDLYVLNNNSGATRRLTTDGQPKSDPDWSPDGTRLVYWEQVGKATQLKVFNIASGEITVLVADGQNQWPAWSPDGKQIAFFSPSASGKTAIRLYDLTTSTVTDLVNYDFNNARPEWYPDGSQIAFMSDRDGNFNIYVASADGLTLSRLTSNSEDDSSPTWQPQPATIDFSNTALGQGVNIIEGTPDPALQEALGPGDATIYAPKQASLDDFITVRLQLAPQVSQGAPQPTPDLPARDTKSVDVYRFMGARLKTTSKFADQFDLFSPSEYIIQLQENGDNYWEWQFYPKGDEALGKNPFVIELFRPAFESNGAVIETQVATFRFTVEVVDGQAEPSKYVSKASPQAKPKVGFTVQYSDDQALSIVFTKPMDVSSLSINGPNHPPIMPVQDFEALATMHNQVQAGTCLSYIAAKAAPTLIRECQNPDALFRELSLGDIFWFIRTRGGIQPVMIYFNGETYSCSEQTATERCDL